MKTFEFLVTSTIEVRAWHTIKAKSREDAVEHIGKFPLPKEEDVIYLKPLKFEIDREKVVE